MNLPLFEYLSSGNSYKKKKFEKLKFSMVLKFHQKFSSKYKDYFFKELEFMELKHHEKLKFPKFEYSKSYRSLHISEIVIN